MASGSLGAIDDDDVNWIHCVPNYISINPIIKCTDFILLYVLLDHGWWQDI